jgi:outer membrane protein OmpA-like peptidoglycan-associated protein
MTTRNLHTITQSVALCLVVLALGTATLAQPGKTIKVEGLITGRSGDEMLVQLAPDAELPFHLTDSTQVSQVGGLFKASHKEMSMAALIPGLKVKAEGTYDEARLLVATKVTFNGNDLEHAQAIEAGTYETKMQAQANQEQLERHVALLKAQNEALQQQQEQVAEQQKRIAANKAAIDAAVARFGQLDDYYIFDELTVYFGNGQVNVDPKYDSQLMALADKAKTIEGYMIEVMGYASTLGSAALNQKLSQERAANVSNNLLQQGHVPLTRMLAPGAMGESQSVGNEKTAEGQAENRRVVVRVLQNKAIAGM